MRDLTKWAIGVTVIWLGSIAAYVICNWCKFLTMEPNAIGDFLAGTMSPLALFWLVAGYMQQGEELRLNTEALQAQLKELALQVESTKVIADSSKQQADISREAHEFNRKQNEKLEQERLNEHIKLVAPSFLVNLVQISGGKWECNMENVGGHALDVRLGSLMFDEVIMGGNHFRIASGSHTRIYLARSLPPTDEVFLTINCTDIDHRPYSFDYSYEQANDRHYILQIKE